MKKKKVVPPKLKPYSNWKKKVFFGGPGGLPKFPKKKKNEKNSSEKKTLLGEKKKTNDRGFPLGRDKNHLGSPWGP